MEKAKQPIPQSLRLRGLVDTGASCTCLDTSIIAALQLAPTGSASILSPTTGAQPHQCSQYDVSIILLHPDLSFNLSAVPVISADLKMQGIMALIGRDVLENCLLVYDGKQKVFTLAF